MIDQIVDFLRSFLPDELTVFLLSSLPVGELRLGLPWALGAFDMNWFVAFPLCVIGNMLFIPFVLLFIKRIFKFLKRFRGVGPLIIKLEEKGHNKGEKIEKNKKIGVFMFVAIPLPGTGAWTGALVAALLGIRIKHSLPIIFLGVIAAGLIMSFISYALPAIIALF